MVRDLTPEEEFLATLRIHPEADHFENTIKSLEDLVDKARGEEVDDQP